MTDQAAPRIGVVRPAGGHPVAAAAEARVVRHELERRLGPVTLDLRVDGDDPIGPWEALAAFSFGRLATFIPVPPGGLGTTDALITSILVGFGLDNNTALAATMIWRAATFFPQVVIGGITLIAFQAERNRPGAQTPADT